MKPGGNMVTTEKPRPDTATLKNIFIVDNQPLILRGIRQLFESEQWLSICGESQNAKGTPQAIKQCSPDLVILDISLPDGSGLELIKRIHAIAPNLPILVSSMHDERLLAERALQAGALGYVSKQEALEHLVGAVKKVLGGKIYLSEAMTDRLLLQRYANFEAGIAPSPISTLTNRELEVFEQIGGGCSTLQIAEHLNLSVKTIETHRAHLKEKLNLASSAELTRYAMQWSLQSTIE